MKFAKIEELVSCFEKEEIKTYRVLYDRESIGKGLYFRGKNAIEEMKEYIKEKNIKEIFIESLQITEEEFVINIEEMKEDRRVNILLKDKGVKREVLSKIKEHNKKVKEFKGDNYIVSIFFFYDDVKFEYYEINKNVLTPNEILEQIFEKYEDQMNGIRMEESEIEIKKQNKEELEREKIKREALKKIIEEDEILMKLPTKESKIYHLQQMAVEADIVLTKTDASCIYDIYITELRISIDSGGLNGK